MEEKEYVVCFRMVVSGSVRIRAHDAEMAENDVRENVSGVALLRAAEDREVEVTSVSEA